MSDDLKIQNQITLDRIKELRKMKALAERTHLRFSHENYNNALAAYDDELLALAEDGIKWRTPGLHKAKALAVVKAESEFTLAELETLESEDEI